MTKIPHLIVELQRHVDAGTLSVADARTLAAETTDQQRAIYDNELRAVLELLADDGRFVSW